MDMSIRELIKPITISLRSKLFICVATIMSGYSYSYVEDPLLRLLAILVLVICAEAIVFTWGNFFLTNIIENLKMTFNRKKVISWVDMPEFMQLADKMGVKLNSKHPFGVIKGVNNAFANLSKKQIIFGDLLLEKSTPEERLALAAHEFTHINKSHAVKMSIFMFTVFILVTISLMFATSPTIVKNFIHAASLIIAFVFINRKGEYEADYGAAEHVGINPTISLLQNLVPFEQWDNESEMHPSINDRVARLKKKRSII